MFCHESPYKTCRIRVPEWKKRKITGMPVLEALLDTLHLTVVEFGGGDEKAFGLFG